MKETLTLTCHRCGLQVNTTNIEVPAEAIYCPKCMSEIAAEAAIFGEKAS